MHANGSKDDYLYGIKNQDHVSEHNIYNIYSVLTGKILTKADGSTIAKSYYNYALTSEIIKYALWSGRI